MKKYLIVIVLLIGVLSCRIDRTDDYEIKVFNEIFDNLVEEMGALSNFEIPPLQYHFLITTPQWCTTLLDMIKRLLKLREKIKK